MTKVIGEITSLSTQTISELEALYDIKVSQKQLASIELINTMVDISSKIGREIAVFY